MTAIPKPANPTAGYTGIYDAWNRLTAIKEGGDFVAEYAYDGAKRRTIQKSYASGVLSETRHFYYTEPNRWQVVEERVGSPSFAERQFVWGLRYIDDFVLRDRDTDGNGSPDERLYALQDANWNVTAITNASETVQECYAYSAYGVPIFLNAAFGSRGSSSYQWETLFAGYRWDRIINAFHLRFRIYIPALATWLQRDPVATFRFVLNFYQYTNSSPLGAVDPHGLDSKKPPLNSEIWDSIPACPCSKDDIYLGELAGLWNVFQDPKGTSDIYHPGSSICFRIWTPGVTPSNQCCFDSNGALITSGPSAGTPDVIGPGQGGFYFWIFWDVMWGTGYGHYGCDVKPFEKLDWEMYHASGWKPKNDPKCKQNPPTPKPPKIEDWILEGSKKTCFQIIDHPDNIEPCVNKCVSDLSSK